MQKGGVGKRLGGQRSDVWAMLLETLAGQVQAIAGLLTYLMKGARRNALETGAPWVPRVVGLVLGNGAPAAGRRGMRVLAESKHPGASSQMAS